VRRVQMKDQRPDGWRVPGSRFIGNVWLYREVIVTKAGVGAGLSIHPATIVRARYHGAYEEAPWLCFPLRPAQLMEPRWREWDGGEDACTAILERCPSTRRTHRPWGQPGSRVRQPDRPGVRTHWRRPGGTDRRTDVNCARRVPDEVADRGSGFTT
jgi:hypothetical protein